MSGQQGQSGTESADLEGLQRRAVRGAAFSVANQVAILSANIGTMWIAARHLAPAEVGLVSVAISLNAFLTLFRDGGFSGALIQRKELTEREVSSVFWLGLIVGAILAAGMVAFSGPIAIWYAQPRLAAIVSCVALPVMANAVASVQVAQLRRNLCFGRLLMVEGGSVVVASICAVVAIVLGAGIWALVIRMIVAPILTMLCCWLLCSWRPTAVFSCAALKGLWSFGGYLFLATLAGYGIGRLDGVIITGLAGVAAAGTFLMARTLAMMTLDDIISAVARVMFPVFSAVQDDAATIRSGFRSGVRSLAALLYPVVAGLVVITPDAVPVALGADWLAAIPLIQIVALQGLIVCVNYPAGQILCARGYGRLHLALAVARGAGVVIGIVIGCQWGALGVAVSWTIVRYTVAPVALLFAARDLEFPLSRLFSDVWRPAVAAGIAGGAVFAMARTWQAWGWPPGAVLIVSEAVLGIVAYSLVALLIMRDTVDKMVGDLGRALRRGVE